VKLDAFSSLDPKALKARGLPIVHDLLKAMHARAERVDEEFAEACSRLSKPWQATMLLAHILERFERDEAIPEIVRDFPEIDDRSLIIAALKEIKEPALAKQFQQAEDVIDDDPGTHWKGLGAPDPEHLVRLHKKIFALMSAMDEPFPSAE